MSKYQITVIEEDGTKRVLQNDEEIENLRIVTNNTCENNKIKIYYPAKFVKGCLLDLRGVNTEIILHSTKYTYNFKLLTASGANHQKLVVGKNCSMWNNININITEDNAQVYIGDDCMLSKNIEIWGSDGHAIIDKVTNQVLNKCSRSVTVGNHVWVGSNVILTKGADIPDNSVVGTGSVVTRSFKEESIVIAGNPAKIIRRGIVWSRKRPLQFEIEISNRSRFLAVIPARYRSSRFPGKPLALISGKPMIQWVYERVSGVPEISEVCVATDDGRIFDAVEAFGGKAVMTGECACGSDRVYQACKDMKADIVLNIQGDEPMIGTEMIRDLISAFNDPDVSMATLKKEITAESDINNPNIAKLITDKNNDAIYFSRSTIPYNRDGRKDVKYYKHIGVYGYTKDFLKTFVNLPQSPLEAAEQLEQLRAIENGYKIRVVETKYQSIGVDLPEHIAVVEEEMKREGIGQ